MVPADMMVCFWRYKRIADRILVRNAQAMRAATHGTAMATGDGWSEWRSTIYPMSHEIDPPEPKKKRKPKGRKVVQPVTLEELEQ